MTVSIKETSATLRTIELSIPQESLKAPFDKKVAKYRKEVTFKGFRQGQVPKQMILSRFGDAIRQEAIDELLNQTLTDELKKAGINPVGRVKVEEFKDDKENDISLKATVEVDPVIDIQGYDSLGISVPEIVVSDAEVDEELARLRQMWSKDESADRASRTGDVVVGNYLEVVIDGVQKDIPEEKEFRSLLGESSTPGFDQGLVGVSKGDIKEIDFVYPEDHRDEAYRGKTAKFKVEITDVREVTPPAMDEEFFKQIGVKDMEELRHNLAEGLANSKKQAAKAKAITEAMDLLIEKNPFEVPQGRILDLIRYTLKRHQHAPEDAEIEPTEEQVKTLTPEAIREIKKHRILDFVANKEKLKATQAQVDARLEELAKSYHVDFESMKNYFRQSGRIMSLREELRIEAAADFLVGIRPEASANS
ncbi:MAG: trigger factor [Fibrobacter sp.]|jgi:trigger factor|nr:trigger factor [Fibrobacter sp.]